jgi:hypothetical protein
MEMESGDRKPQSYQVKCEKPLWQADGENMNFRKYMPALFIKNKLKRFL